MSVIGCVLKENKINNTAILLPFASLLKQNMQNSFTQFKSALNVVLVRVKFKRCEKLDDIRATEPFRYEVLLEVLMQRYVRLGEAVQQNRVAIGDPEYFRAQIGTACERHLADIMVTISRGVANAGQCGQVWRDLLDHSASNLWIGVCQHVSVRLYDGTVRISGFLQTDQGGYGLQSDGSFRILREFD